jgi:hypothetical protein
MSEKLNTKKALTIIWKILDDAKLTDGDVQTIITGLSQWREKQADPVKTQKGDDVKALWPEEGGKVLKGSVKKVNGEYVNIVFEDGDIQWVHQSFIKESSTPAPAEEAKKE